MKSNIRTGMKNIVLHCQRYRYRYQYDAAGKVLPAIKENIGPSWTINARVDDLHPESVGQEIYSAYLANKIGDIHDVAKVTHNGVEIPSSFRFLNDLAEGLYGPSY